MFGFGLGLGLGYKQGGGSEFSPIDLSPALWLDASDTSTITEAGGLVSQWDDKSGNANHATQGSGSAQPATGTRTVNGLNVLDFASDWLSLPSGVFTIPSGDNTVFVAANTDSTQLDRKYLSVAGSSGYLYVKFSNSSSRVVQYKSGGSDLSYSSSLSTDHSIVTGSRDGTSLSLFQNGGTPATSSGGSDVTGATAAYVGDNQYGMDGSICEILAFSSALNSTEMNQIGNYLSNKWGITWTDI